MMKGLLFVDKPKGPTSHDIVNRIRHAAHMRRVGHTGTLDPAATGLLILCLGAATRLTEMLTGLDKEYEGAMQLGVVTDSYDLDGVVIETNPLPDLTEVDLRAALQAFTGPIQQVPPMISAVRIGGERLYKKARKGETVDRPPRSVTVREFAFLAYEPPYVRFRVCCSSGTYVRSLCHDVGKRLGCGATLAGLRRTRVGKHSIERAQPLDVFVCPDDVLKHLAPIECALDLPEVAVPRARRRAVLSGNVLHPDDLIGPCPVQAGWVQVKSDAGELLALAQVKLAPTGLVIHPRRVLVE